jgi:5'-nucleotidase
MNILIDMDGVLADFVTGFKAAWANHGLPDYFGRWEQWDLTHYIPVQEHKDMVDVVMCQPGLFRGLPVMPGAVDAVLGLMAEGHQVWICSTPVANSPCCMDEKLAWLKEHFGAAVAKRAILTQDKTIVRGEILVDDRPDIHGALAPSWEHVVYDQPYNREVTDKRRMTWANWRNVLL